jgi:site-specific recombinase XerC
VWWPDYATVHLAPETRDVYAIQLDLQIISRWGGTQLRDLTSGAIEAWVSKLRRDRVCGDATIIKTVTVMRAILRRAKRDGELERNPAEGIAKPKQQRARTPTPITPLQVERLRAYVLEAARAP